MTATALAIAPAPVASTRHRAAGPVVVGPWQGSSARPRRRPVETPRATYRRRRIAAAGLLAVLGVALWLAFHVVVSAVSGGSSSQLQPVAARTWVVQPGDTAWSIAIASGARGDIRPVVDAIEAETGRRPLQPGQLVEIP